MNQKRKISFYVPGLKKYSTDEFTQKTPQQLVPVSVTGKNCSLKCEHCKAKLLESMLTASPSELFDLCKKLKAQGAKGILITGGSNIEGQVPLYDYSQSIKKVKDNLNIRVIVHTGLVDENSAKMLSDASLDIVMLDIIGADETISSVYHLNKTVNHFEESLYNLKKYNLKVVPHIVLGLHFGEIIGEYKALEIIKRAEVDALVLVIIMPLIGTPMENIVPPAIDEIQKIFKHAKSILPDIPVLLGCARPAGELKLAIDKLAVEEGLDGIAYPAEGIVEYAESKNIIPEFHETCCAMEILRRV